MTTTMSCFKKEQFLFLYRFSLKKTAGWTAIYTILLFLCYPLILFKEAASMANRYPDYPDRMNMLLSRMTVTSFMVSGLPSYSFGSGCALWYWYFRRFCTPICMESARQTSFTVCRWSEA